MTAAPRDRSDIYLAPVALAADARLEELGRLPFGEMITIVEGVADYPVIYRTLREAALIDAVRAAIPCHGWAFSVEPRGLRLTHREHSVVLGLPASLTAYLDGARSSDGS